MDIVLSGNINCEDRKQYASDRIHQIVRSGYTLYVGTECNDGRPITESWRYKRAIQLGIPIIQQEQKQEQKQEQCQKKLNMFTTTYKPIRVQDIIGHKEQINQIATWLSLWDKSPPTQRGILITGPPGIGKTTSIHLIAKELGYRVTEYNASDTRSISTLRGLLALGMKRFMKEIIVMDEIDGLSERGGVGEIALMIKHTNIPIICISNQKPPKLRPIISACIDIKFNRPLKSTIAKALLKVTKAEGICINTSELEELCEKSGNDIRSILNRLEFYGKNVENTSGNKDAILRHDLFSATQRLMSHKTLCHHDAEELVFVDYHMVPLMVQEAYISACKDSVDEMEHASELLSFGDTMDTQLHRTNDWNLLPHIVANIVSVAKSVSGPAPFQLFPQYLGKTSKKNKHVRLIDDLSLKMSCSSSTMRLDYAEPLQRMIATFLQNDKNIKQTIHTMDALQLTRDDVMDTLYDVTLYPLEIATKIKSTFTREYNKMHPKDSISKIKSHKEDEEDEEEDEYCT